MRAHVLWVHAESDACVCICVSVRIPFVTRVGFHPALMTHVLRCLNRRVCVFWSEDISIRCAQCNNIDRDRAAVVIERSQNTADCPALPAQCVRDNPYAEDECVITTCVPMETTFGFAVM